MSFFFNTSCKPNHSVAPCHWKRRSSRPVECLSYTIRHKYPERLVTYDAEERCEPRQIRVSDLAELQQTNCKNEENVTPCSGEGDVEMLDRRYKPFDLNDKLTKRRMNQLDRRCRAIFRLGFCKSAERTAPELSWQELSPVQKLTFCWKALTRHDLRSTPYENFRHLFISRHLKNNPQLTARQLGNRVRRTWMSMKHEQRVPFNLHALLYHVGTGALDPFDHCAVRMFLNRWR